MEQPRNHWGAPHAQSRFVLKPLWSKDASNDLHTLQFSLASPEHNLSIHMVMLSVSLDASLIVWRLAAGLSLGANG